MYVFEDKGEERLALRPEGTAGTVRAFIEHGAFVEGPQKWFYMGPMFRRERPQKGRYRQFHQIGCEAFGIAEPAIDAEQIAMLADYLGRLGRDRDAQAQLGGRPGLPAGLPRPTSAPTSPSGPASSAATAASGPRRTRSASSTARCRPASRCWSRRRGSPTGSASGCRDHFDAVKAGLDALGVAYRVEPRLVRGLDYYVRTAYEFTSDALGAQSAVAGGGRYDGLVETLGGPPTPGIGFALGVERLALILEALKRPIPVRRPEVFLVSADAAGATDALPARPRRSARPGWPATSTPAAASSPARSSRPSGSGRATRWCWAATRWRAARPS